MVQSQKLGELSGHGLHVKTIIECEKLHSYRKQNATQSFLFDEIFFLLHFLEVVHSSQLRKHLVWLRHCYLRSLIEFWFGHLLDKGEEILELVEVTDLVLFQNLHPVPSVSSHCFPSPQMVCQWAFRQALHTQLVHSDWFDHLSHILI